MERVVGLTPQSSEREEDCKIERGHANRRGREDGGQGGRTGLGDGEELDEDFERSVDEIDAVTTHGRGVQLEVHVGQVLIALHVSRGEKSR